jgi:hypothetical protein
MREIVRRRYVLHADGAFLYYLDRDDFGPRSGRIQDVELRADDTPMTRVEAQNYKGGWYAADHRATEILVQDPAKKIPVSYTLKDPEMASAKYPLTITPEQWQEMAGDENRWQYDAVNREEPAQWVPLAVDAGDWALIEGTPPPKAVDESRPWVPDLLPGLMERAEYHHVMPGHIPGLAAYIGRRLRNAVGQFAVSYDHTGRQPGVTVDLAVPFERPVTHWQANTGRNGQRLKSGKTVQSTVQRRLRLPVPAEVVSSTYAQALAAWDEAVEFWLGVVQTSAGAGVKTCNHCEGHGFVGGDVYTEFDVPRGTF